MNRTNKPSLLSELNSGDMFDRQIYGVSQLKSLSKANYLAYRICIDVVNGQNKRNTQISIAPIRIFLH